MRTNKAVSKSHTQKPMRGGVKAALQALVLLIPTLGMLNAAVSADSENLREVLRNRIESADRPARIIVGDEMIHAGQTLPEFYEKRVYRPAWTDGFRLLDPAEELIGALRAAHQEGLNPADYHLDRIRELEFGLNQAGDAEQLGRLADLDLLLTDSFLIYAAHLVGGRIDPETLDPLWNAQRREVNLEYLLHSALETGRIQAALDSLHPVHPAYTGLRRWLQDYRRIAAEGGWPQVTGEFHPAPGIHDPGLNALRLRLEIAGDFISSGLELSPGYDPQLQAAVRRFQLRHGLNPTGRVDEDTRQALNVPVEDRIRQIKINLERIRWLPRDPGRRYIQVNMTDFSLAVVEAGQTVMTMKVIIGKSYRRTPVFSDKMTYLVINPYWDTPKSIAVQDKLPLIRKDPGYLAQQKMRVYLGWGADRHEIDPASVDWAALGPGNFPYRLRQDPGPQNALGRLKFMFPNKYNVYIHDTPSRELFAKTRRTFSSGCIRIEQPLLLAEYLLSGNPNWTRQSLQAAIDRGVEQTVSLPVPIAVHLVYLTAWVDSDGGLQLRNDVYQRDAAIETALEKQAPAASKFSLPAGS